MYTPFAKRPVVCAISKVLYTHCYTRARARDVDAPVGGADGCQANTDQPGLCTRADRRMRALSHTHPPNERPVLHVTRMQLGRPK